MAEREGDDGQEIEKISSSPDYRIRNHLFWNLANFLRKLLFTVLSAGPIPLHIACILDGNRRFARNHNLSTDGGYLAGFAAVIRMLKYCYELGVKYVTVYAFSIDNYRRRPKEVELLMNLFQVKLNELSEVEGLLHQLGVRVYFAGNPKLVGEPLTMAMNRVMEKTAKHTRAVLVVCLAYTSTDEITHSIQVCADRALRRGVPGESPVCNGSAGSVSFCRANGDGDGGAEVRLEELERNMYMAVAPVPDIVVRTSGETRLSNFLLWQTSVCQLYSPATLWPEIGLWNLVWAVMKFQRGYGYTERKKEKCGDSFY